MTKINDEVTLFQLVDIGYLAAFLKKFKDVFKPLPSGLPLKKEMAHTTHLEVCNNLLVMMIYCLNPKELEKNKEASTRILKEKIGLNLMPHLMNYLFFIEKYWTLRMVVNYHKLNK